MLYYKMDKWLMCVVALILGMLVFHMLSNVCGCKVVEGNGSLPTVKPQSGGPSLPDPWYDICHGLDTDSFFRTTFC